MSNLNKEAKIPASEVGPGDRVDLAPFASEDDANAAEFEYGRVIGTERETLGCVRLDFENFGSYGLDPARLLDVIKATPEEAAAYDVEALDLSGGDPGYHLVNSAGPVILTLETPNGIERKAAFSTIDDAESYLNLSTTIDPVDLIEGRYGIDAPHGATNDDEAAAHAVARGFRLLPKDGAYYWAPPGPLKSTKVPGRSFKGPYPSKGAAALAALATVDPD